MPANYPQAEGLRVFSPGQHPGWAFSRLAGDLSQPVAHLAVREVGTPSAEVHCSSEPVFAWMHT